MGFRDNRIHTDDCNKCAGFHKAMHDNMVQFLIILLQKNKFVSKVELVTGANVD